MITKQNLAFLKQILSLQPDELLEWCSQNGPDRVEQLNELMDRYAEQMQKEESTLDSLLEVLQSNSSQELTLSQAFKLDLLDYPSRSIH
jgi:predicted transcriptional regulator